MQTYSIEIVNLVNTRQIPCIVDAVTQLPGVQNVSLEFDIGELYFSADSNDAIRLVKNRVLRLGFISRNPFAQRRSEIEIPDLAQITVQQKLKQLLHNTNGVQRFLFKPRKKLLLVFHNPEPNCENLLCKINNSGIYANRYVANQPIEKHIFQDSVLLMNALMAFLGVLIQGFIPQANILEFSFFLVSIILSSIPLTRYGLYLPLFTHRLNTFTLTIFVMLFAISIDQWFIAAFIGLCHSITLMLQRKALDKTKLQLTKLKSCLPSISRILLTDNKITTIATRMIKKGYVVAVKKGEYVPVDGSLVSGNIVCQEKPLTGIFKQQRYQKQQMVFAGQKVVEGEAFIRTQKLQCETIARNVLNSLVNSQYTELKHETNISLIEFGARALFIISAILPFALAFPPGGTIEPQWLSLGLALVIISLPISLSVATHISYLQGIYKLANRGLHIKNLALWPELSRLKQLVIDKTSVLTINQPEAMEVISLDGKPIKVILSLAASIAKHHKNPSFKAIVRRAEQNDIELHQSKLLDKHEQYIKADINQQTLLLGDYKTIRKNQLDTPELQRKLNLWENEGSNAILLATEDHVLGFITILDPVRTKLGSAIENLHASGIESVAVLSEDNTGPSASFYEQYGFDKVFGELNNQEKIDYIQRIDPQNPFAVITNRGDIANQINCLRISTDNFNQPKNISTSDVFVMGDDVNYISELRQVSYDTVQRTNKLGVVFCTSKLALACLIYFDLISLWGIVAFELLSSFVLLKFALLGESRSTKPKRPQVKVTRDQIIKPASQLRSLMR
ncbi:MAG: HAD-IC family P-type ATPase [Gammaproteobacteria bacterium]|nr:HAD-IC family P-type ATPase [Gammaproteobacteria bacterium]